MMYQNHKYKLLITSILFLLLGIAFMVYPAHSMIMLVRITGCFMILLGILIFIPSFREKEMLGFRFGLLVALTIIIAVFGVILLVMPDAFVGVFWITLGIILILDGLKNLLFLPVTPFKVANVILSVLSVICGVLILIHPFGTGLASMVLIGAFFAYSGAAGIALSIISKIIGKRIETAVYGDEEVEVIDSDEGDGDFADEIKETEEETTTDDKPGKADDKPAKATDVGEKTVLFDDDEVDPYERETVLKPKKKG